MPDRDPNAAKTRDEDMKPGSPPHPATEPPGAEDSSRNTKTLTNPSTGEPEPGPPSPT